MTAKTVFKTIAWITVAWAALMVFTFNDMIFYDPEAVDDRVLEQLLIDTGLARDEIDLSDAWSARQDYSGDYAHALCVETLRPLDTRAFKRGDTIEDGTLALARPMADFVALVPSPDTLRTPDYLIDVIERSSGKLRFLFKPAAEARVCYVAVRDASADT